jgi:hypothetical protein
MKSNCHGACCYCTDCKHEIDECVCGRFGMKEKISVDEHVICFCHECVSGKTIQLPTGELSNMKDKVNADDDLYVETADMKHVIILQGEYDRLNCMENNIKSMIEYLDENIPKDSDEFKIMSRIKVLLEALLK